MKKFQLCQEIAQICFSLNKLEDLENLVILIKQQRDLANKLFWSKANSNTGKTAIETQDKIVENEKQIKKHTSQMSWQDLGI